MDGNEMGDNKFQTGQSDTVIGMEVRLKALSGSPTFIIILVLGRSIS